MVHKQKANAMTGKFVNVIVDISNENVDKPYMYILPEDMEVSPGQRVLVPFGRANKPTEGLVLSFANDTIEDASSYKYIIHTLEAYPVLDAEQIELAMWMRRAYHCTTAKVLRLMMPAQLRGMRVREKRVRVVRIASDVDIDAAISATYTKSGVMRAPTQNAVLTLLRDIRSDTGDYADVAVHDITEMIPKAAAAIKTLVERGILIESQQSEYRRPDTGYASDKTCIKPELTKEQKDALSCIEESEPGSVFLLHGVTGSGKTEVYLRAIEKELESGHASITLVPEISLTPQTVGRFRERFHDEVAILHSRLSHGERFDEWRRIRLGQARVVVGARSAVFAPVQNLGLIIIDEEHEHSYPSEQSPRYNAADIAIKRIKQHNAKLVLGSATPALESYYKAQSGIYKLLKLQKRVGNATMPVVDIVDMRLEFLSGNNGIFSTRLKERLEHCLSRNEQAIIFINRRGYASYVSCRACGYVFKCTDCDISFTYHKSRGRMLCHYCGKTASVPKLCPECGRPYLKYTGVGTQQVEEELKNLFPDIRILRMDADTTSGKDAHSRILSRFASGEAQVLTGTQMIAKGLDFPGVTLVGVVLVDSMLNIPDFRNDERAFQLLAQVSGRAGRAELPGSVVIQSNTPEHPVIEFARTHDYEGFYEYAIAERMRSLYPPFAIFIRVMFLSPEDEGEAAQNEAVMFSETVYSRMLKTLADLGGDKDEILSIYAMSAPISRIQGKLRYQVLIKIARTKRAGALIRAVYDEFDARDWIYARPVEVNPQELL